MFGHSTGHFVAGHRARDVEDAAAGQCRLFRAWHSLLFCVPRRHGNLSVPFSFAALRGLISGTCVMAVETNSCAYASDASTFPTQVCMVKKDSGSRLCCPQRLFGRVGVAPGRFQFDGRCARQSFHTMQIRGPRSGFPAPRSEYPSSGRDICLLGVPRRSGFRLPGRDSGSFPLCFFN